MLLMHENIPVADVKIYLGNIVAVDKIYNAEHLPIGTNHPGPLLCKYLNSWQKDRAIPFDRQSLDLYTKYFGKTPLEAAQVSGSFSLTDHYWFKEKESTDKWEDYCFQNNGFFSNFPDYFLDMISLPPEELRTLHLPDINTNGVLPKLWIQTEENQFTLYKLGEYAFSDKIKDLSGCHLLSANEVACSKIAKLMNINATTYTEGYLPGIPNAVCQCQNFVPDNMEFVTLVQIAKESAGKTIDLYRNVCDMGYKKEIEDMLKFFFLIHNKDGHTKNCGFLRDAKTLEIKSFAPLFDHGCSLNYDGLGSQDQSVKPFRTTRKEQIALVENLGSMPQFDTMAEIIKETYDTFSIPDVQLDLALEDLIETCNEWEQIATKEEYKNDMRTYE